MADHVVIVGGGQAAAQAAASLRSEGHAGAITIIGEEIHPPYQRPPLSKKYLSGELAEDRLFIKPPEFYEASGIGLKLGVTATAIDRSGKRIATPKGDVAYDKLVLATGSHVRRLNLKGSSLANVFYLRSIADVDLIRPHFEKGKHLVIIGAGYIGLEVAAVAATRGLKVSVVEIASRCLARVTSPVISSFFDGVHRKAGVHFHYDARLEIIEGHDRVEDVLVNGEKLNADFVIAGIGILPSDHLARDAGLTVENGIVVDEFGRTSDPDIYAAGDCTVHFNPFAGRKVRLESVQNAIDQAKIVAAAIVGKPRAYAEVPWFWSDQYDLKLQTAGLFSPTDQVVLRGDPATAKFAAFYLRDGVLAAVDAINAAPEFMMGKLLIANGARLDPARLADPAIPMKNVAT